jgi:ABC-type glycerol-3-phosphate transport system substrate-binding protein
MALDDFVNKMPDKDDIYAAAWNDTKYKGHIYGLPWGEDIRTLVYRKDIFEEVGLNPNNPPETWAEYLADAKKLAKFNNGQMVREGTSIGIDTSIGIQQYFATLFFQAGGSYYTADGKANFDSPAGRAAAGLIEKLIKEKATSPSFVTPQGSDYPLTLGTSAMRFDGISAFQNARAFAPQVVDKIGIAMPLRMDKNSAPTTVVWVDKVAIFKGTKHPNAAWNYAAFITSAKWESKWAGLVELPTRKSVVASPPWSTDPAVQTLMKAMKYAHVQPANPHMFQIPHIIKNELMNMIYGKLTAEQALKQMDSKINAILTQ